MSEGSTIEWLQRPGTKPATWNPIRARDKATGKRGWFCVHVHAGCTRCYAEKQNTRGGDSGGNGHAYKAQNESKVDVYLDEKTLLQPLHWREPRTIFVCSMSDLYGSWVKDEWLDRIKAVEALCPQHTFIELTKRPERMRAYLSAPHPAPNVSMWQVRVCAAIDQLVPNRHDASRAARHTVTWGLCLPNVWGVASCSTQEDADKFVPEILQANLAVRGVSAEPLLGPIDFTRIAFPDGDPRHKRDVLTGQALMYATGVNGNPDMTILTQLEKPMTRLDWIIVGGESGKDARPMHPDWARSIRNQCKTAGVAFFFKQWGGWAPNGELARDTLFVARGEVGSISCADGERLAGHGAYQQCEILRRVGKKAAGRLLDGKEHNEFPVIEGRELQPGLSSPDSKSEQEATA